MKNMAKNKQNMENTHIIAAMHFHLVVNMKRCKFNECHIPCVTMLKEEVMVQTTNVLTWNLECGSLVYL
jgi:hypothetical protein